MPAPIIPWEPSVFPTEIQDELNRRKTVRGFNYVKNDFNPGWDKSTGDWSKYSGPMSSWVRVCSNGYGFSGSASPIKPGFVLYGGKNFYDVYGFNKDENKSPNQSIIGYTPKGIPHVVNNDLVTGEGFIHVPVPEINKITSTIQKELYRRVSIEWTCFSAKQLEYMTPYFLVPGISVIIEWGWNHFNPSSLVDLTNESKLKDFFNNPYPLYTDNILASRGNYDVTFGIITNFEWSIEGNKIHATTEVTSKDRIYAGLVVNARVVEEVQSKDDEPDEKVKSQTAMKKFIENNISLFKSFVKNDDITEDSVPDNIKPISSYILHKNGKDKWKSITRGIFYGRDQNTVTGKVDIELSTFSKAAAIASEQIPVGQTITPTGVKVDDINTKVKPNNVDDFDVKDNKNDFWMNMWLVVEILNYHSSRLELFKNQQFFRVDIDDCVISGHPNLISTDSSVLLIPNAESPKYFYGRYGINKILTLAKDSFFNYKAFRRIFIARFGVAVEEFLGMFSTLHPSVFVAQQDSIKKSHEELAAAEKSAELESDKKAGEQLDKKLKEYNELSNSDIKYSFVGKKRIDAEKENRLPDWRLMKMCWQPGAICYRDDIDAEINKNRYFFIDPEEESFEFPFLFDTNVSINGKEHTYPARYCGHFKNLYLNSKILTSALNNPSNKSFVDVYTEIFKAIERAGGGIWDFALVNGDGKAGLSPEEPATMKIVDYNFTSLSVNSGNVFTFTYGESDSILQSLVFRPTLSNAQAVRTIYSQNTNPDKKRKFTISEQAQLLDYKFKDRLFLDDQNKQKPLLSSELAFVSEMENLQGKKPSNAMMQMTLLKDGKPIIKRLVLPDDDVLNILLDDGDFKNNPRYTGIMPGITAEFTLQGVGGIRTFQMFLVRNLPKPYSHEDVVFRVVDVTNNLESGKWTTVIKAGLIPLRGNIKNRLGITK